MVAAAALQPVEPIAIRWFQSSDREVCQRIAAEAAMTSYGRLMPERRFAFTPSMPLEPAEVRLVATCADEPVGFLELVGTHVSNVFVDPAHQRRGVGAALMRAAEETIPGDLTLSVFTSNPAARRFYERLGYRFDGVSQTMFHGLATDVWRMRKARPQRLPVRKFDLVILDFDGVLADSAPWMLRNIGGICERHGLRRPEAAMVDRLRGLSNRQILRELRVPVWKLPAIARDMRAMVLAEAAAIPLFSGVATFLERLQAAGVRLAIVSSNSEAAVRQILGPGEAGRISRFCCGAALFGKARLFARVQRELGVAPGRVLCVGDETRDVEAARKAGFRSAAATWGYATPAALHAAGPDHLVDGFEALSELIIADECALPGRP
jgi:phosphoglycolate phosphatase